MQCESIMKRKIECVSPEDRVEAAARRMRDEDIGFLPVCDNEGKVIGTLTDRDIAVRVVADDKPASTHVEEVMSHEVVACRPDADLEEAKQLMASHHKSRILCIDTLGHLAGIISLSDLAQSAGPVSETFRDVKQGVAQL
ncbi:MAG: CBS domain-containing protein [Polyangiaceae bacterium]